LVPASLDNSDKFIDHQQNEAYEVAAPLKGIVGIEADDEVAGPGNNKPL
jgi:hypothetical protein